MNKAWTVVIVIVVIVVLGLGIYAFIRLYGGGTKTNSNPAPSSPDTVSIENFSFNPSSMTVKAGTEVTFTNNDSVTHTVTFDNFDSGSLASGAQYKHTFSDVGTFNYHCSIHPSMTGSITVQ